MHPLFPPLGQCGDSGTTLPLSVRRSAQRGCHLLLHGLVRTRAQIPLAFSPTQDSTRDAAFCDFSAAWRPLELEERSLPPSG